MRPALSALPRPARPGRRERHNRVILIRDYVPKVIEQIPTTEALRARLRQDPVFRWIVGYRGKSDVPSAATFSRIFDQLSQCPALQAVHAQQVETAHAQKIVSMTEAAYDASDIIAHGTLYAIRSGDYCPAWTPGGTECLGRSSLPYRVHLAGRTYSTLGSPRVLAVAVQGLSEGF